MTKLKLKKSDGYWLCNQLNDGCHCENRAIVPCRAIAIMLAINHGDRDDALIGERERIRSGMLRAGSNADSEIEVLSVFELAQKYQSRTSGE